MAGKRKNKTIELVAQPDPRAALDGAALLALATPVLAALTEDLLARADGSVGVTRALKKRHAVERDRKRTADGYAVWRRQVVVQIGAAWLLSCVFVRTLEDRGLLERNRIAGPGAVDGQQMFFQLAPYLTERDYLLMVFREVAHVDAVRGLFGPDRSLVWRLAPSAEGARRLLELFRAGDAEAPAFRFGQADTRFLGDLYQDLDEGVRKRFALLQTPDFIEEFILDRTLEPAIEKFGLERTDLIDPTCGSGHFLLGAFGRLFDRRLREEPGVDVVVAASKALDAVAGVDINPYAVAIARFRLTLAFLEKAGFRRLEGAPVVEPNVVVADSLLHNYSVKGGVDGVQVEIGDAPEEDVAAWKGEEFRLEDEARVKKVLGKGYAAVVGNPPYITVKDKVLRERYRGMYSRSAAGKYSVAAPFTERFFQLGRTSGRVGMITANSFMKREFGKKLIEQYLPSVNLDVIVNTSGAYIPGHGTPTVLLFGAHEDPQGDQVLTVLANRGEPSTPEDPRKGAVWSSIAEHWQEVGFENEYVSVMRTAREKLGEHPWSLAGGGATELKALLEERAAGTLGEMADSIGITSFTLEDDVFLRPADTWSRLRVPKAATRPMTIGEVIRDWTIALSETPVAFWPYDDEFAPIPADSQILRAPLWPWRTNLANNKLFGDKTKIEGGLRWYEYGRLTSDKLRTPLTIAFAFVATHNHFVLDRGGKVFKQTAPIIKLPETATEDDHLALLAYLNSSTACFWMKQVFYPKATAIGDISVEKGKPEANRYEFAGTGLKSLPLPSTTQAQRDQLTTLAKEASALAEQQQALDAVHMVNEVASGNQQLVTDVETKRGALARRLVVVQEDIDWIIYDCFGLYDPETLIGVTSAHKEQRPYVAAAEDLPIEWTDRKQAIKNGRQLTMLETPLYKRQWDGRRGVFGHSAKDFAEEVRDAANAWILAQSEDFLRDTNTTMNLDELKTSLDHSENAIRVCTELLDVADTRVAIVEALEKGDAIPFLASLYLRSSGLEKRAQWRHTWDLQRREDAGESVGDIPVPPKYTSADFASPAYYRLRGKLDVPKERFISYPGCASDHDASPVYGWAGWDHAQRAQALAQLYLARKTEEAWTAERLTPMLAGLDELIFWLELWHGDPHPDYGMPLSTFYTDFIASECRELDLTLDDLRAWRPPKGFGKKKRATKKKSTKKRTAKKTAADPTPADPSPKA